MNNDSDAAVVQPQRITSPYLTALLSIIFTPAFGFFVQWRNQKRLRIHERSILAGYLIPYVAAFYAQIWMNSKSFSAIVTLSSIVLVFVNARHETAFIKKSHQPLRQNYRDILTGVAFVLVTLVAPLVTYGQIQKNIAKQKPTANEAFLGIKNARPSSLDQELIGRFATARVEWNRLIVSILKELGKEGVNANDYIKQKQAAPRLTEIANMQNDITKLMEDPIAKGNAKLLTDSQLLQSELLNAFFQKTDEKEMTDLSNKLTEEMTKCSKLISSCTENLRGTMTEKEFNQLKKQIEAGAFLN